MDHRRQIILVLAGSLSLVWAMAGDWPQWRGPGGEGISSESDFVTEWGPDKNILWKTPIPGRGHSSPIVWGDRIFLTSAVQGEVVAGATGVTHYRDGELYRHPQSTGAEHKYQFRVLCLDLEAGKILWQRTAHEGVPYDNRHRKNTYASSTPVTDGRRVFTYFESQGVFAYDYDGELLWSASVGEIPKAGLGPGTSPVLYQDLLILQVDKQGFRITTDPQREVPPDEYGEGSFLVALDQATGKEVWRTPRNHRRSWATPMLLQGSPDQLVTSGAESVISYDPATGRALWKGPGVVSHPIPSPVFGGGLIFATAGSSAKHVVAIRPDVAAGDAERVAWTYNKGTAYVPSPIYYRGYLYLLSDKGIVTCLDPRTGRVVYEGGRVPVPATFKSSPVAFDGKILLTSEEGDTFVIKAGPRHEVLGVNTVGEPVWASPALSKGRILIRGAHHLFGIGKE